MSDILINTNPKPSQAKEICTMYQEALGKGGIYNTGCDQYPDPDLFSISGVESIIATPERQLIIAEADSNIVGGAIVDWTDLKKRHCEINCLATSREWRGRGAGRALFNAAKKLMDELDFVVNTTEFVTHSMHSQAAFINNGQNNFVAFSFCHYPRVFFAQSPESVIWMTTLHGRNIAEIQPRERTVYLPKSYATIGETILFQFANHIRYHVTSDQSKHKTEEAPGKTGLNVNPKGTYRYCHFNFTQSNNHSTDTTKNIFAEIDQAFAQMKEAGKEFILARIPANSPNTIEIAEYLKAKRFAFHGVLPINEIDENSTYQDILTMQWIDPEILASNSWPGDTDSVIKIYGYPANITKDILKVIAGELYYR